MLRIRLQYSSSCGSIELHKQRSMNMKAWHFSNGTTGYDDGRKVEAGQTYTCEGDPVLCVNGMHGSIKALDALAFRKGCIVSRVRITGDASKQGYKVVGRTREVLWVADATEVLRKFARLCALDVISDWEAPDVVVRYLKTGDESIRREAMYAATAADHAAADAATYAAAASYTYSYTTNLRNKQNDRLTRMLLRLK